MTSCALCRREQEINPELLRARFDEQRVLNLAQRLAIPPPVCSRPTTSGSSVPAGEGGHNGKERNRLGDTPTSTREMLFGPWGDVGAMSTDDLRRRWKFSAAPGGATVGAASASELCSSWRELQSRSSTAALQVSHGARTRADNISCSGHAEGFVGQVGGRGSYFPTANPDFPCAGECPLEELSLRWRNFTRIPPETISRPDRAHHVAADETSHGEPSPIFERNDSGGLGAAVLRKRWHEANGVNGVGALTISELRGNLSLAVGSQGVGGIPIAELATRWSASITGSEQSIQANSVLHESADESAKEDSDDTAKSPIQREQAVGAVSTSTLQSRCCVAGYRSAPVG